jgi:hypothetical protein
MSAIKLSVHGTGTGVCSLTSKPDSDGLTVTFEDDTIRESFLSWRGFRQLLELKLGANAGNGAKPAGVSAQSGGGQP